MNNHELDSLESSEALGEDDSAVDFAFDSAFDLGTSPHGLPADLPEALSNLAGRSDCTLLQARVSGCLRSFAPRRS